jgi:hypothetical protein
MSSYAEHLNNFNEAVKNTADHINMIKSMYQNIQDGRDLNGNPITDPAELADAKDRATAQEVSTVAGGIGGVAGLYVNAKNTYNTVKSNIMTRRQIAGQTQDLIDALKGDGGQKAPDDPESDITTDNTPQSIPESDATADAGSSFSGQGISSGGSESEGLLGPGGRALIRGDPDREMFSYRNPNFQPATDPDGVQGVSQNASAGAADDGAGNLGAGAEEGLEEGLSEGSKIADNVSSAVNTATKVGDTVEEGVSTATKVATGLEGLDEVPVLGEGTAILGGLVQLGATLYDLFKPKPSDAPTQAQLQEQAQQQKQQDLLAQANQRRQAIANTIAPPQVGGDFSVQSINAAPEVA